MLVEGVADAAPKQVVVGDRLGPRRERCSAPPGSSILIVAGLQTIPNEVYEAGRLDGASKIQMFRRLTVPLLRPILAMVIVPR
ncbi:MAG: multiple sugar transport system permease protein [Pseudonocardia sp.]